MNWAKFKNSAIIAFVIINLILYILNTSKFNTNYILNTKKIQAIEQILTANKIDYSYVVLPKKYEPLAKLEFEEREISNKEVYETFFADNDTINSKLSENLIEYYKDGIGTLEIYKNGSIKFKYDNSSKKDTVLSAVETKILANEELKKLDFLENTYELSQRYVDNNNYIYEYNPKFDDKYIFMSYVKITVSKKGVEVVDIYEVKKKGFDTKTREVISIDRVLLNLVMKIDKLDINNNYGYNNIQIMGIDLGYNIKNKYIYKNINKKAEPYYKILINDKDIFYINAYTNYIYNKDLEFIG